MNDKTKNMVIVILCVITLGLGGYLVYDKILSNNNEVIENNVEENYDLVAAKELVSKYVEYGTRGLIDKNIFKIGLTDEMKMLIALRKVSVDQSFMDNCSAIYDKSANATKPDNMIGYYVELNNFGESATGFCSDKVRAVSYDSTNKMYKNLFGSDEEMPKEDVSIQYDVYDFISNQNENFYVLESNVGGIELNLYVYGIKDARKQDNKLIVNVGYSIFKPQDASNAFSNNSIYVADFDNKVAYTYEELNTSNISKQLIEKYSEEINTYKFMFFEEDGIYKLESIVKE